MPSIPLTQSGLNGNLYAVIHLLLEYPVLLYTTQRRARACQNSPVPSESVWICADDEMCNSVVKEG